MSNPFRPDLQLGAESSVSERSAVHALCSIELTKIPENIYKSLTGILSIPEGLSALPPQYDQEFQRNFRQNPYRFSIETL